MSKGRLLFYLGFLACGGFWFSAIHLRMTYLEWLEIGYRPANTLPIGQFVRNQMVGAALMTALFVDVTWWRLRRGSECVSSRDSEKRP